MNLLVSESRFPIGSRSEHECSDRFLRRPAYKHRAYDSFRWAMTLLAGIIGKDGIVIAADSQTTRGDHKWIDSQKIKMVNYAGVPVMVAESGNADFTQI